MVQILAIRQGFLKDQKVFFFLWQLGSAPYLQEPFKFSVLPLKRNLFINYLTPFLHGDGQGTGAAISHYYFLTALLASLSYLHSLILSFHFPSGLTSFLWNSISLKSFFTSLIFYPLHMVKALTHCTISCITALVLMPMLLHLSYPHSLPLHIFSK